MFNPNSANGFKDHFVIKSRLYPGRAVVRYLRCGTNIDISHNMSHNMIRREKYKAHKFQFL